LAGVQLTNKMALNKIVKIMQLLILIAFALFFIAVITLFELNLTQKIILGAGMLFLFLFLSNLLRKLSKQKTTRVVLKEIPIIKEVPTPVKEKKVKKKKVTPPTKYIASKETNTYHLRTCRFSKLIKNKHAVKENTKTYYKNNKFKACKMCKPNRK